MAAANVVNTLIVPAASKVAPYYDDFDESKNFHRVMFRPGYAVQARELTQLQTILQNQVERFGRHIFVNGSSVIGGKMDLMDVITLNVYPEYANSAVDIGSFKNKTIRYSSGNNYVTARVVDTSVGSNTAPPAIHVKYLTGTEFGPGATIRTTDNTLTANLAPTSNVSSNGSVAFIYDSIYFMQGHFVKVPAHSVVVSKHNRTANVKVGLELIDNIITEADDISLLDPALESSNYQAPGAGRYQLILQLATRSLDSIDDAKWIQIGKIQGGVLRELVTTPIYSEIEEVLARRTYDESGNYIVRPFRLRVEDSVQDSSNNFTLVISPGKAYLYGYEVENQAETRIEIPRAKTINTINNYNLNCNYGNYVIVDNLEGAFPVSTLGLVDMHCVSSDLINYASSSTYNASKIGTARVRDINFYGGEANVAARKHEFYFFDTKFRNITGNATSSVGNNQSIIMNTIDTSGANGAYVGAFIKIIAGNSAGDIRIITAYDGNSKTATVYPAFSYNIDTSSRYELQFDITDVDSFVTDSRYSGTGATTNAAATISIQSKDDGLMTGNTFAYDPKMKNSLFVFPQAFVAPGLSDQSYVYRRVYSGVSFTSGNSSVITAGTDEDFVGATSASNNSSTVMDNFLVVVTANTGSSRKLGEQIKVSSTVTTSTPEQATLFTGNTSDSFVATVYVKMNARDTAAQPRVKTLVLANTQTFTTEAADANFISETGSNTYVYLDSGQIAIKNPSATQYESLYISDVIRFVKIYTKDTDPVPGEDLTLLTDVTNRYTMETGQKPEYYDHASIRLKAGFAPPKKWLIVCCRYYKSTNDLGYFSVDSYPYVANTVFEEGKNIGTGYSLIPVLNGLRLADAIDFRPVRPNASNTSNFIFPSVRTPVAATDFNCDYNHYLERRDIVTLSMNDTVALTKGIPSLNPYFPAQANKTMLLQRLRVLPYTLSNASIIIENIEHKRYTMEDISVIDRRVKNLEYNVTLNALEKNATDIVIRDVDGLDRTKYGILADSFTSHLLGDAYSPDYLCAVDVDGSFSPTKGILMPGSVTYYDKLEANSATMVNVSRHEDKVTLAYKTVPAISQGVATKAIPLNSFLFAEFRGQIITVPENDRWKDMITITPETISLPKIPPYIPPPPYYPPPYYPPPYVPPYYPPITCLVEDTMVTMADGDVRRIDECSIGDIMLTTTGKPAKVVGIEKPIQGERGLVSINGGKHFASTDHIFKSTDNVWFVADLELAKVTHKNAIKHIEENGGTVKQMEIGDNIITIDGVAIINSIDIIEKGVHSDRVLYDLTLEDSSDRTYYADGFGTHNCGLPPPPYVPPFVPPVVQKLLLDGGKGLSWNAATGVFDQFPGTYNYTNTGLVASVGMSDAMYQKVITDEIRNSKLPGADIMTPSMTVLNWVDQGYQTLLDRPGEPAGVAFWAYTATKNGWTQLELNRAMAQGAIDSGEAIGTVGTVEAGRIELNPTKILQDNGVTTAPPSQGVILGNNIEINGPKSMGHTTYGTPTNITQTSQGTAVGAGGSVKTQTLTSQSYITNLYSTLFDRSPDTAGLAYWTEKLESGALDIQAITNAFITSPEGQSKGLKL